MNSFIRGFRGFLLLVIIFMMCSCREKFIVGNIEQGIYPLVTAVWFTWIREFLFKDEK